MTGGYFIGPPARRRRRPGRRALPLLLLALAAAAAVVFVVESSRSGADRHAATVESLTIDSKLVGRKLEQKVAVPAGGAGGRPLLVLLHGRGAKPGGAFSDAFFAELGRLGARAPVVVEVDGGDHSYYHDRKDGRWGSYVVREVIPALVKRYDVDGRRIALGGMSMGGFGALDIAGREPGRFCAVGGHSAALWRRASETPDGAFDNAADFKRHDVYGQVRGNPRSYVREQIWLDAGTKDPFRPINEEIVRMLKRRGRVVTWHGWPGGHGGAYFNAHVRDYLRWYARQFERCAQERGG
jgi:S-formylglutathione hydrolase FrmB